MTGVMGIHALVCGRVQGVGFRWYTRRKAETLGLSGWVRNLVDGRVEACFLGDPAALEDMKQCLAKGPAMARVDQLSWENKMMKPVQGFTVRPTGEEADHA